MPSESAMVYRYTKNFSCLTDRCPDTCCHGAWGMQVGDAVLKRYKEKAPELLSIVEQVNGMHVVACDSAGTCTQFKNGFCGVHAKYGEQYLGDACYFYPRITRQMGDAPVMMAAMSCPETVRLILETDRPFERLAQELTRIPERVNNVTPEHLTQSQMLEIIDSFVQLIEHPSLTADYALECLLSLGLSLDKLPPSMWVMALPFYQKTVGSRLLEIEKGEFYFVRGLEKIMGLLHNFIHVKSHLSSQKLFDRLIRVVSGYEGQNIQKDMEEAWGKHGTAADRILKRWLQGAIVMNSFPFAGLGNNPSERIRLIAVRYLAVKLGLQLMVFERGVFPSQEEVINLIYSIARIFDHLSDAKLLVTAVKELGLYHMEDLLILIQEVAAVGA